MDYLMVIDNATGHRVLVSLDLAEQISGIQTDEIESAVSDCGCCNSIDFTIIDTRPAKDAVD
ncbi:hypothetical protein [Rhizobium bangladeshense]|uniref:hypothetical protein n=1 Tax=Rhizobium bangladeshense TaxID=1138189 RepID=UPI001C82C10B|nr:hypothetical protein [Rhizobium bangladeshense]MBX4916714.1 hypothetical protein [Rhizobium bangladeshense]